MSDRKRRNELAAGAFVTITLALTAGTVVWLGISRLWAPVYQQAVFFADESAGSLGLARGNVVQVNDAPVGRIDDIRFDAPTGRTLYIAQIDQPGIWVHSDGQARVVTGLVGDSRLVITDRGGSAGLADEANPLRATGGMDQAMQDIAGAAGKLRGVADVLAAQIRDGADGNLLSDVQALARRLAGASAELETMMASLRPQMDADRPGSLMGEVRATAANASAMTAELRRQTNIEDADSILSHVRQTTSAAADTAVQLRQYTREDLGALLADVRRLNSELLTSARNLSALTATGRDMLARNRDGLTETMDNLTRVSSELKAASKEIRRSPWRLLYKPKGRELDSQNLYDAARAFADGAEQLDQALAKLSGLPTTTTGDDPQVQQVRSGIEQAFGRFNQAEQALWKELVDTP